MTRPLRLLVVSEQTASQAPLAAASELAATLRAASLALTQVPDLAARLQALLAHLAPLVPHDQAAVLLLEPGQRLVTGALRSPAIDPGLTEPWYHRSHPGVEQLLNTHQTVHLPDVASKAATSAASRPAQPAGAAGQPRSWLGVPLQVGAKLAGLIVLVRMQPNGFDDDHVLWAELLAAQAGLAVEHARLLQSVGEQREQMRSLNGRLTELEETARRRLSQELHDRVGQSLTVLSLNLTLLRGPLAAAGQTDLVQRTERCMDLTETMSQQVRDVMVELRPPVLDDYGLFAALRWYGEHYAGQSGLNIEVLGAELGERLPLIVETVLFRITQEALNNVAKHARASRVAITLQELPSGARLTIADDGEGFSPQRPRGLGERPRWGLITMRERAETVGATMNIHSAIGQGARVVIEVAR